MLNYKHIFLTEEICQLKGNKSNMMKKIIAVVSATAMLAALTACGENKAEAKNKEFSSTYEVKGTTSTGAPKNDTYIFEGKTVDGKVTELKFDIIRNKGLEGEYSKKDIMGYMMNVSDAEIKKTDAGFDLSGFTSYGYDAAYGEGGNAQYMVTANHANITDTTMFKDIKFLNYATGSKQEVTLDKAIIAYQSLAAEAGIKELTGETLVKDILVAHELYKDGSFVEGKKRVSFNGVSGGRSYGEQIDAIVKHIIDNKMTLEEVYDMFKTVNQGSVPVEERDAVSGATIAFGGDFARTVYLAINGKLFEGATGHKTVDGNKEVTVLSQGYAGEVTTVVTFDADNKIVNVKVKTASETPEIGGKLTAEGSEFIGKLVEANGEKVDVVAGATKTSDALNNAVKYATEYVKTAK